MNLANGDDDEAGVVDFVDGGRADACARAPAARFNMSIAAVGAIANQLQYEREMIDELSWVG